MYGTPYLQYCNVCKPPCPRPYLSLSAQTGGSGAHGVTIDNHLTTLPLKKGLSSSAAVCVLVVRALCLTYGLELSTPQVSAYRIRQLSLVVRSPLFFLLCLSWVVSSCSRLDIDLVFESSTCSGSPFPISCAAPWYVYMAMAIEDVVPL